MGYVYRVLQNPKAVYSVGRMPHFTWHQEVDHLSLLGARDSEVREGGRGV